MCGLPVDVRVTKVIDNWMFYADAEIQVLCRRIMNGREPGTQ
jgi:hypothetical protein